MSLHSVFDISSMGLSLLTLSICGIVHVNKVCLCLPQPLPLLPCSTLLQSKVLQASLEHAIIASLLYLRPTLFICSSVPCLASGFTVHLKFLCRGYLWLPCGQTRCHSWSPPVRWNTSPTPFPPVFLLTGLWFNKCHDFPPIPANTCNQPLSWGSPSP